MKLSEFMKIRELVGLSLFIPFMNGELMIDDVRELQIHIGERSQDDAAITSDNPDGNVWEMWGIDNNDLDRFFNGKDPIIDEKDIIKGLPWVH